MMNQRGFCAIFIVLGIVVTLILVGGAYHLRLLKENSIPPSPIENIKQTAQPNTSTHSGQFLNWKTYTNGEIGYSINYPSDWVVNAWPIEPNSIPKTAQSVNFGKYQLSPSFGENELKKAGYLIEVWVDTDKTLEEVLQQNDTVKEREGYKKEKVDFKGLTAYRIYNTGLDFPRDSIVFQRKDKVFSISVNYLVLPAAQKQEAYYAFEEILKTFTFNG